MAHPRELIRKQAVIMLLGNTLAGTKVFASRVEPFISRSWEQELPAIVVYTMDESAEIYSAAPREYLRKVELVVEIHAAGTETLDDTLDTIARQVEMVLMADDTLGDTVNDLQYTRTRMVLRDEGETLIGGCRISFDAQYLEVHPTAAFDDALPDLTSIHTDYSLDNQQAPADRAKTIIEDLDA